jgi:hypothetical protein
MMEAVRTSETSFYKNFTLQYNQEDNSEHHTRRRENLKSDIIVSARFGTSWKKVRYAKFSSQLPFPQTR